MVAAPSTQISLLGVPAKDISALTVTGSRTDIHSGRLLPYSQGDGASFLPGRPFSAGEHVTVTGTLHIAGASRPFAFGFTVAHEDPLPDRTAKYTASPSPVGIDRFRSAPDVQAPTVHVTTRASSAEAPGDIFVSVYASGNGPGGPMIFEDSGRLVWFKPLPPKISASNLQLQRYDGQPVLTWWQGRLLPQGFGEGEEVIANTSYQQIATVRAGNGLQADLHDFQITAQNTGLLTAYDPVHCDLASIGGPRNGAVSDGVFQEIDLKTGLVRREWHALDHVALADAYPKAEPGDSRTAFPFDYFHINSIDPLANGTTMISSRNTWTIYTLANSTGQVLSRIGGRQSTVKMGPGTSTAWQHDARALPNGEITAFDNGASPKVHKDSRGIVERLDPSTNTMTLVTQYEHSPGLSAETQGSLQTLEDGNVLIGWGAQPYFSEYSSSRKLLFDAHVYAADQSYRALRYPWTAQPASKPTLTLVTTNRHGTRMAYVSWNGATRVTSWRVLAGASEQKLAPLRTMARSGFETTIPVSASASWFEVQALNASGTVIGSSAPTRG